MQRQFVIAALTVGFLAITSSGVRGAGTNADDEAAIRKLIATADSGSAVALMPDRIVWTGAYKRPIVGNEKGEYTGGPTSVPNRVPGTQKTKTEVLRIVVADSRDLAYEYSKGTVEYDLRSGEHIRFDRGILRVWQKQNGEWKEAAQFARPWDRDFVAP